MTTPNTPTLTEEARREGNEMTGTTKDALALEKLLQEIDDLPTYHEADSDMLGDLYNAAKAHLLTLKAQKPAPDECESCEGHGRTECLPDSEHSHPCDDCQPDALKEFNRGVAWAESAEYRASKSGVEDAEVYANALEVFKIWKESCRRRDEKRHTEYNLVLVSQAVENALSYCAAESAGQGVEVVSDERFNMFVRACLEKCPRDAFNNEVAELFVEQLHANGLKVIADKGVE